MRFVFPEFASNNSLATKIKKKWQLVHNWTLIKIHFRI